MLLHVMSHLQDRFFPKVLLGAIFHLAISWMGGGGLTHQPGYHLVTLCK